MPNILKRKVVRHTRMIWRKIPAVLKLPLAGQDWAEVLECARFYLTTYGNRRLFATLPRSGFNWTALILRVAKDIAEGGAGNYTYATEKQSWSTPVNLFLPLDWRTPIRKRRDADLPKTIVFHTHQPYGHIIAIPKNRMKVAVLVRNLYNQLQSWLFHGGYDASTQDTFIRAGFVSRAIDFCNGWGAFLERHPNSRLIRYEELIETPLDTILGLCDFWELELSQDCIDKAIQLCTKERMLQHIPTELTEMNPRVSFSRRQGNVFTPRNFDFIRNQIKHLLHCDFGYDYEVNSASD